MDIRPPESARSARRLGRFDQIAVDPLAGVGRFGWIRVGVSHSTASWPSSTARFDKRMSFASRPAFASRWMGHSTSDGIPKSVIPWFVLGGAPGRPIKRPRNWGMALYPDRQVCSAGKAALHHKGCGPDAVRPRMEGSYVPGETQDWPLLKTAVRLDGGSSGDRNPGHNVGVGRVGREAHIVRQERSGSRRGGDSWVQ